MPATQFRKVAWSHPVPLDSIPDEGLSFILEGDEAACAAIAKRFDWLGLSDLNASVTLAREAAHLLLTGHVSARITQRCVASLDPVETRLEVPVAVRFLPQEDLEAREARDDEDGAILIGIEEEIEDLELLPEADLEMGDFIAQTLALAAPAFPRRADVPWQDRENKSPDAGDSNPFAVLSKLKDEDR